MVQKLEIAKEVQNFSICFRNSREKSCLKKKIVEKVYKSSDEILRYKKDKKKGGQSRQRNKVIKQRKVK